MLVDTHAHLNFPQLEKDLESVIQHARELAVNRIVNVGTNLEMSRKALALAERQTGVSSSAGFHPHDVESADDRKMSELADLLAHDLVVAVGETGLDYFRNYAPHDVQEHRFRQHICLAKETGLPLIIHSRGAEDRVLDMLEEEGAQEVGGALHCFGGDSVQAKRAVDLNFYLGFGGTVTFKKSTSLAVALQVPTDLLLLETDCPYLSPVPYRGKRNEPAYVHYVAEFLAKQMNQPLERVCEQTTHNALRLFRLDDQVIA